MQERTIYKQNASEFYKPRNFRDFIMDKEAVHATTIEDLVYKEFEFSLPKGMDLAESVCLTEMVIIDYRANLRLVPRNLNLWSVEVKLYGKKEDLDNVEDMIKNSDNIN